MLKISVITPSYNQGVFIQKCIDSVIAQQGVQVEHIILDNCSTDQTVDLLNRYREDPQSVDVKIIVEPDNGQTMAINRGFLIATGEVVCWLNTDEYYMPNTLEIVSQYFSDHPEVDILFGDCTFVDRNSSIIKEKKEFGFFKKMLVYYGPYIPSCATFFRKRVVDSGFLLDEHYRVCMDFEYYVRLVDAGFRFAYIPINLAYFTWHETNISSVQIKRRIHERYLVQLRYGGFLGGNWIRIRLFNLLKLYWIARRNIWRMRRHFKNIQRGVFKW